MAFIEKSAPEHGGASRCEMLHQKARAKLRGGDPDPRGNAGIERRGFGPKASLTNDVHRENLRLGPKVR
jgi:hypothetical protein